MDLKDLRANDERQLSLETDIKQLGYSYRRRRTESAVTKNEISSATAAEAVLSIWRTKPHQAKFFTREHFGKLYNEIFNPQLNGTQVVTAVLLYRIAENHRKRPTDNDPPFCRYAACFIAMRMGVLLLRELKTSLPNLNHSNFQPALDLITQRGEAYFSAAVQEIDQALKYLYGEKTISMQQLSATFRRGDLIHLLTAQDFF